LRVPRLLLTNKMNSIAGSDQLLGWGSDDTPWFGGNPADNLVGVRGITLPPRSLAMHPGPTQNVAVGWRSPFSGTVKILARLAHAQKCSDGIEWWIARETRIQREYLAHGTTEGSEPVPFAASSEKLREVDVTTGDTISLIVGPKGGHQCDSTVVELTV